MRILLINVPHPAIGSRIPREQLPPLGLLSVGGPLIDDGHEVHLIDGEFGPMPLTTLTEQAAAWRPDVVMFGHSGSSSGHPVIARCAAMVRARLPHCLVLGKPLWRTPSGLRLAGGHRYSYAAHAWARCPVRNKACLKASP